MTLRVALVGAGRIARESHLPAWQRCDGARVHRLIDRDAEAARELAEEWRIPTWSTDPHDPASLDDVEAVDICTPASTHAELMIACLEAGKHVLVEKPAALTMADLFRAIDAAERADRVAMVAENWLYSSAFRTAQRLLADDEIGRILVLETAHESPFWSDPLSSPRPDADGLGYFFAAGTHTIHTSRSLIGELSELAAFATLADAASSPPCDHELVLATRSSSGALASMTFAGRSQHEGQRRLWFKLIGEKGVLSFDIWSGWVEVSATGRSRRIEHESPFLGFEAEIDHFVSCVRSGAEPVTALRAYPETLRTVLAGYRSAIEHRVVRPSEVSEAREAKEEVET